MSEFKDGPYYYYDNDSKRIHTNNISDSGPATIYKTEPTPCKNPATLYKAKIPTTIHKAKIPTTIDEAKKTVRFFVPDNTKIHPKKFNLLIKLFDKISLTEAIVNDVIKAKTDKDLYNIAGTVTRVNGDRDQFKKLVVTYINTR
jgi:hypothetical protein